MHCKFCQSKKLSIEYSGAIRSGGANSKLEDGYQPGNVFKVPTDKYNDTELQKELSNGRLAMLGTLGYMAQELIQQHPIV